MYVLGAVETFLDAIPAAGIFKRKLLTTALDYIIIQMQILFYYYSLYPSH
jgi:hypothetical protein